jgi:hypothetical protein
LLAHLSPSSPSQPSSLTISLSVAITIQSICPDALCPLRPIGLINRRLIVSSYLSIQLPLQIQYRLRFALSLSLFYSFLSVAFNLIALQIAFKMSYAFQSNTLLAHHQFFAAFFVTSKTLDRRVNQFNN